MHLVLLPEPAGQECRRPPSRLEPRGASQGLSEPLRASLSLSGPLTERLRASQGLSERLRASQRPFWGLRRALKRTWALLGAWSGARNWRKVMKMQPGVGLAWDRDMFRSFFQPPGRFATTTCFEMVFICCIFRLPDTSRYQISTSGSYMFSPNRRVDNNNIQEQIK